MTARRIVIIQGHPDPDPARFCRALAGAYAGGAEEAGHEVRYIDVTALDFPLLRTEEEFGSGDPPPAIAEAQDTIKWGEHLVFVYPLWHGTMPALLKAFIEQVFRHGFALGTESDRWPAKLLTGRSARIIVTMGMPALVYRWYFGAHSLKSFERSILKLCGIKPVRETLIGMVGAMDGRKAAKRLAEMVALGRRAG